MKQIIGGNPAALIRHPDADAGFVASREFGRQDADGPLVLGGFDGILNDVQEDLFDLITIRLKGRKARRQPARDHEVLLLEYRLKQFEPFVNHVGEAEPGQGQGTRPGIVDDLIDDAIETVNFPENDFEIRSARIIGSRIVQVGERSWIRFPQEDCGFRARCPRQIGPTWPVVQPAATAFACGPTPRCRY